MPLLMLLPPPALFLVVPGQLCKLLVVDKVLKPLLQGPYYT